MTPTTYKYLKNSSVSTIVTMPSPTLLATPALTMGSVLSSAVAGADAFTQSLNASTSPYAVSFPAQGSTLTLGSSTMPSITATIPSVNSYFIDMAWTKVFIVATFLLLILLTVVGNTLVILAVATTRRLRTVTNCFVMNLAITDWLVGTCVMPPAVILYIVGSWRFGWILCDVWISLDVLLCTSSILSLCAISLDRYLAVTQPLTYSKKRRSKRLALFMIFIVWIIALSITCPPFLGWYEAERRQEDSDVCRYNQNKGYVVFSAMGSFFIPLAVMLYVYLKIGYVLTSRRQRIVRDAHSERTADHEIIDCENFLSESEHFQCVAPKFPSFKTRWYNVRSTNTNTNTNPNSVNGSLKCTKCVKNPLDPCTTALRPHPSFYELVEISRLSTLVQCSVIGCKYAGGACMHTTTHTTTTTTTATPSPHLMPYNDSRASFASDLTAAAVNGGGGLGGKFGHQHQHNLNDHHHHQCHSHHHHRVPMRISTTKRDSKTAKTLTIVMGGFIACWLPFFIYYLLIPFLPPAYVIDDLMTFITWVGWVNSAINPFIYAFYNPHFRTAFWRLTCQPICKPKLPENHMAMFRG